MPSPDNREKALESALAQIDRQFGKGSVMRLGSDERAPVEVIPTGSIALDVALGVGGLPRGRIVEIYGPESSGKTTLTLHAIANVQKQGGIAAFIDAEHALDPEYAQKLGVDIDELLVSQPDTGEQALEIADMLIRSGSIDLIVIDSVAALVPKAEIEGEMGDSHVGLQARLMSQALRKLTGGLNTTNTTMIFINQLREKIGVFFGSPETTAGGKALKFYASVRLDIRRIETLKDGTDAVGNRTRVKVVKNKMAPPFKQAEFDILYGTGISREGSLIDFGVEHEIVKKSGSWYTYDGEQLGQGKENARSFLIKNEDVAAEIESKIKVKLGIGQPKVVEAGRRRAGKAPPGLMTARKGDGGDATRPRHLPAGCRPRRRRAGAVGDPARDERRTATTDDCRRSPRRPTDRRTSRRTPKTLLTRRLRRSALSEREARTFLTQRGVDSADRARRRSSCSPVAAGSTTRCSPSSSCTPGRAGRVRGRRAIAQTLSARGSPRDVADAALARFPTTTTTVRSSTRASKAHGLRSYDLDTAMRRLMGQLARRGYSGSVAATAARTALAEQRSSGGVQFR